MTATFYDKIIIGAGLYGLYAALRCGRKGQRVLVLEYESAPFTRATYVNQARVHNGYHYPRSYSTAVKSARYFDRFARDYGFCIHSDFKNIYGIAANHSWTNAGQFKKFCHDAQVKCEVVDPSLFFSPGACEGAFETQEYTYDAVLLRDHLLAEINRYSQVACIYNARITTIQPVVDQAGKVYRVSLADGSVFDTPFLLNAAYASVNQIIRKLNFEPLKIKYELCEIILCRVNEKLKNTGITVMDGPFFSIIPFGKTGLHSLTAVSFTPHLTSYSALPDFPCQRHDGSGCSPAQLANCNHCPYKPKTAWPYMSTLAKKYLLHGSDIAYVDSLYSIKPILMASEIDDSRPTVIRQFSEGPTFISVLSGKINTMYDLDEVL